MKIIWRKEDFRSIIRLEVDIIWSNNVVVYICGI